MNKSIILLLVFVAAVSAYKYQIQIQTGNKDFKKVWARSLTVILQSKGITDELTLLGTPLEKNKIYEFAVNSKFSIDQIEEKGIMFGWNINRLPTVDSPNPIAFKSLRVIPSYLGDGPRADKLTKKYCGNEYMSHDSWYFLNRC